jgi:hypothetical protein
MIKQKTLLGYCAVDSGQLIVVDPCYLNNWKGGDYGKNNDYTRACEITRNDDQGGEILVTGQAGIGVVFSTGWGDGSYPVEAEYENGRIKNISISFF